MKKKRSAVELLCTCEPIDVGPRAVFAHRIYTASCPRHTDRLASEGHVMLWNDFQQFNDWKLRQRV